MVALLVSLFVLQNVTKLAVREPNSENCLDLIFIASPCVKVIFVSDRTAWEILAKAINDRGIRKKISQRGKIYSMDSPIV